MKNYILLFVIILSINTVFADSPLTSTDFYKAYMDVPLINKTAKSNGVLTDEIFEYLNSNNCIDKKIALINALKWNLNGKNNAVLYLHKLFLKHNEYSPTNFYKKGTAEELICYAYLKGMDNYFDVKNASLFSLRAIKLNPNSYTIAIVNQLIISQMFSQNNWCEIYSGMNTIKENNNLNADFRRKATEIIFEYTNIYKDNCTVFYSIKKFIKGS